MDGNYFHCDVSSSGRPTAVTVLLLPVLCEFQALSNYTIHRSSSGCNTAVTVRQTKDVRAQKMLHRLPTRKATKHADYKSDKSHFCWRKAEPWGSVTEEDSIHFFWDTTLFWFVNGFRRFEANNSNHPTRERHITATSKLALLNLGVKLILDSCAFYVPCIHFCTNAHCIFPSCRFTL
jgi:hypothetical protein